MASDGPMYAVESKVEGIFNYGRLYIASNLSFIFKTFSSPQT